MVEKAEDKRNLIGGMFDSIAGRYDFLNHLLSLGIDRIWRRKAVQIIGRAYKEPEIIDVATGTADLAIAAMRIKPRRICGIDISEKMLQEGRKKIAKKKLGDKIDLRYGASENIPFNDSEFDVAMVAFGVRNFADPAAGLSEMKRVLRPGGMIVVLEFTRPTLPLFRKLYFLYFQKILPLLGKLISGDSNAYSYLPDSVMQFPDNEKFVELMEKAGFTGSSQKSLSLGIAAIYTGYKSLQQ